MAKILDKLLIVFGLDSKEYDEGAKRVQGSLRQAGTQSNKTGKQWEKDTKTAVEGFRKIRNELLAIGGAYLGLSAVKSFTQNLFSQDVAALYLSKNLGMGIETLERWQSAAKRMGSSAEDIGGAFQHIVSEGERIKTMGADPAFITALQLAGVHTEKFLTPVKNEEDLVDRMKELARAASAMSLPEAQYKLGQAGFSEKTINMLHQGEAAIDKYRKSATNVASEAQAEAERQMAIRIQDISDRFTNLGRILVDQIGPPLLKIADEFTRWLLQKDNVKILTDAIKDFGHFIMHDIDWKAINTDIRTFAKWADEAAQKVGGWKTVVEGLIGLWAAGKFMPVISGLLTVVRILMIPLTAMGGGIFSLMARGMLALLPVAVALAAPLAAVAAAVAAIGAAYYASEKYLSGTKLGDKIGEATAHFMALFSDDAKEALLVNNGIKGMPYGSPQNTAALAAIRAQQNGGVTTNNTASNSSVGPVTINVNGANKDPAQIAKEVNTQLQLMTGPN